MKTSRRNFIGMAGSAGLFGLAGCAGFPAITSVRSPNGRLRLACMRLASTSQNADISIFACRRMSSMSL